MSTSEEINTLLEREIVRIIGGSVLRVNFVIYEIISVIGYNTLYEGWGPNYAIFVLYTM